MSDDLQPGHISPDGAEVAAVRCTCRPGTLTDWSRLEPLTGKSSALVRGKVLCRTGRYDEAVKRLEPLRSIENEKQKNRDQLAWTVRVQIRHHTWERCGDHPRHELHRSGEANGLLAWPA